MKKLYEILGLNKPIEGTFGIEVEVEGENLKEVNNNTWISTHDGSLRGESYEYITKKPIDPDKVPVALRSLNRSLKDSKLEFSFRTSVHVHMNVQDLDRVQIMNLIYLYLLFEEPLMTYCGRERKGNRFCLRLQDAEGIVGFILTYLQEDDYVRIINQNEVKYAAINIAALSKFGSLEFRGMRGTLDEEVLSNWTKMLLCLKKAAIKFESPSHILENIMDVRVENFTEQTFGELTEKLYYPRFYDDVRRSFSLSLDIPTFFNEEDL